MTTKIDLVSKAEISGLISSHPEIKLSDNDKKSFLRCLRKSSALWVGQVDGDLVCMFGLIPPTLADDRAYLWLHTTDKVKDYEFTFVRQSQIAVRKMLESFPLICGHCEASAERSQRWVRWLGATFGRPEGKLIPFQIVRNNG